MYKDDKTSRPKCYLAILKAHLLTKSAIQFTFKFKQWTAALLEFIISIIS